MKEVCRLYGYIANTEDNNTFSNDNNSKSLLQIGERNDVLLFDNSTLNALNDGKSAILLGSGATLLQDGDILKAINNFAEKYLPSLYYQQVKKSIFPKVSFEKLHRYKRLPLIDINKGQKHFREGVLTKLSTQLDRYSIILTIATIPVNYNRLREHQQKGEDTIKEYIDLALAISTSFIGILQFIGAFAQKATKLFSGMSKTCVCSMISFIEQHGGHFVGIRVLPLLSRFLGILGLMELAWIIGWRSGKALGRVSIGEQNLQYYIDGSMSELFNHPYKWASKLGYLNGTLVVALLVDAVKRGIDISVIISSEENFKKLTPQEKYKLESYKLRNREMYIQSASPKYYIKSL